MFNLEWVLRRRQRHGISEQIEIILSPELLALLQQKPWLNGWVFFLSVLQSPPLLAAHVFCELRQLAPMDANGHVAEFGCVVSDHFLAPLLVQLLPCHLRCWHVRQHSQSAVFSLIHSPITVLVLANHVLHWVEFIEHLLSAVSLKHRFRSHFWVVNVLQRWGLNFVFLFLVNVG